MTTLNEARKATREATRSAEILAFSICDYFGYPRESAARDVAAIITRHAEFITAKQPAVELRATPDEGATPKVDDMTQTVFTDAGTIDAVPKDFARQLVRELNAERSACALALQEAARLRAVVAELQTGHDRYEFVRKLSPRQFHDLYMRNIQNNERFDDLVDAARAGDRARGVGETQ